MSKRKQTGFLRASAATWTGTALLAASIVVSGCSGESSDAPQSSDTPQSNGRAAADPAESGTSLSEGAGEYADASTSQSSPSQVDPAGPGVPGSGTGMQLPTDALPDESGTNSDAGPTPPGQGGIEMPDLGSGAASAAGEGTSSPIASGEMRAQLASWQAIEAQAKSTGKITVVDLWSTSCAPCIEEFPGLVRLSEAMPEQVACIGVSVDYDGRKTKPAESYSEKVNAFLTAVGARFDNFLCNTPSDDVFSQVDLPSIPAVLIFNAQGELVKRFVDAGETVGFSYDKDIIPFVKELAG